MKDTATTTLPVVAEAVEIGREIHRITQCEHRTFSTLGQLRECAEDLAITIAISPMETSEDDYREALNRSFEQANNVEFLLFHSLFTHRLSTEQVGDLFHRLHAVKRSLVAALSAALATERSL